MYLVFGSSVIFITPDSPHNPCVFCFASSKMIFSDVIKLTLQVMSVTLISLLGVLAPYLSALLDDGTLTL